MFGSMDSSSNCLKGLHVYSVILKIAETIQSYLGLLVLVSKT